MRTGVYNKKISGGVHKFSLGLISTFFRKYSITRQVVILALLVIIIFPLYLMLSVSLKTEQEFLSTPFALPKSFQWENYLMAAKRMKISQVLFNSTVITGGALTGLVILGSMAAYPIARMPSKFNNLIFILFISGLTMPFHSAMIPLFKVLRGFGILNTHQGMIVVNIATSMAFSIFLFTGFMRTIPKELEEAAFIDGCSTFKTYWKIIFPLLKTVTATVVIFNTMLIWNDFLKPLLYFAGRKNGTMTTALYSFQGQYETQWTIVFAACTLSSLPLLVVYLTLQKYFIKGIVAGSVKG